ncbi:MAG: hypothetical protein U5K32_13580 [Bacteroidales bacterium]|nr:hypothetical protein [Bacteroidales bacterium]
MKRKTSIIILMFIMMLFSSCGGPDALLINIVREDGSVERRVLLTYHADEFDLNDCQVPVDSTWDITRSLDISENGDTTYSLTAVKEFDSVDMINKYYDEYEGSNPLMNRKAGFRKKFRWFNTVYRYTETVERALRGIEPGDYFSEQELEYFYMPEKLTDALLEGPDSTIIEETMIDPLDKKKEEWMGRSLVRAFVLKLADTVSAKPDLKLDTSQLFEKEDELSYSIFEDLEEKELVNSLVGEGFYENNRILVDTLLSEVENEFLVAFETDPYLVQVFMPGELTSTNGYIDEDGNVLWEVKGEVFLSSDFNMWAESKTLNLWAWIITGAFVLFVIIGLIVKAFKK